MQQAFLEEAALQCGICTPGFIVAAKGLLDREPDADEGRIRHWLAGNLCRCTGYDKIIRAVLKAEDITSESGQKAAAAAGTGAGPPTSETFTTTSRRTQDRSRDWQTISEM